MDKVKFWITLGALFLWGCMNPLNAWGNNALSDKQAIIDFLNLRYGMFIHYNMGTYHQEQWAYPFHDPKSFKPTHLDCKQWAKAAKSAGMKYAVLTAKHHDGFCLWNTTTSAYDIASSDYKTDIVRQYVDAFRAENIKIGLYFSVMDWHQDINKGNINTENIAFMKKQLTELLTNYGEIICIVIDGWGSKWGGPTFEELPFDTLADHIHSIQPKCLVINHSCNTSLSQTEVVHYEATHGQHCPYDNVIPSQQGPTLQQAWFWEPGFEKDPLKPVDVVIKELNFANSHYSNYLLNVAPNDKGLLDENVIKQLAEIGKLVHLPDKDLEELPELRKVQMNVTVVASSEESSKYGASNVVDANLHTQWKFDKNDPEKWIELDFSRPETFNKVICGEFYQDIRKFKIEAFVKGKWTEIVKGGKMGVNFHASFPDVKAQKYRLTVIEYDNSPLLSEITFVKY